MNNNQIINLTKANITLEEGYINSVDLVTIINYFRAIEREKGITGRLQNSLQHKTLLIKIRKELETLKTLGLDNEHEFMLVDYVDAKGQKRPCYKLNRDGMLQILNGESVLVRYKTIEYINQLEQQNKELKEVVNKVDTIVTVNGELTEKEWKKIKNKSKYLTTNIYDSKSVKTYLLNAKENPIELENRINEVVDIVTKVKSEIKHELIDSANKTLDYIDNNVDYSTSVNSCIKSIAKDGKSILKGVKIDKLKTKTYNTEKKVDKLEQQIKELKPVSLKEMYCCNYHPFTWNCAIKDGHRTDSYNRWLYYFPYDEFPSKEDMEAEGIDFTKPIRVTLRCVHLEKFDTTNLSKSFIDALFNDYRGVWHVDDCIVRGENLETVGFCDSYADGKIYWYLENFDLEGEE